MALDHNQRPPSTWNRSTIAIASAGNLCVTISQIYVQTGEHMLQFETIAEIIHTGEGGASPSECHESTTDGATCQESGAYSVPETLDNRTMVAFDIRDGSRTNFAFYSATVTCPLSDHTEVSHGMDRCSGKISETCC